MIPRFDESEQIAELIADESLCRLAALAPAATPDAISAVAVFNPSSWKRGAVVETKIVLPRKWSPEEFPEHPRSYGVTVDADVELRLVKPDGTPIPAEFTHLGERMTHTFRDFDPVFWQTPCHEWHLRAAVEDLDPMSVTVLSIEEGEPADFEPVAADDNTLENERLRVRVNANGTLDIRDKATGHEHRGLLLFEDVGDAGDEYDFSGLDYPGAVTTAGRAATTFLLDQGPGASTLRVQIPISRWSIRR
jgi:hypothetical protein